MPALTLVLVVLHQHMQKFLMYLLPMQAFSCNEIRPFLSISQQAVNSSLRAARLNHGQKMYRTM